MKKIQFYIPILFENEKVTLIKTNKIKEIDSLIPDKNVIKEFLIDQYDMIEANKGFNSMKIMVDLSEFESLKDKIKSLYPKSIPFKSSIDLVIDTLPVIQIMCKNG